MATEDVSSISPLPEPSAQETVRGILLAQLRLLEAIARTNHDTALLHTVAGFTQAVERHQG